jgi:hypothetical protein
MLLCSRTELQQLTLTLAPPTAAASTAAALLVLDLVAVSLQVIRLVVPRQSPRQQQVARLLEL